MERIVGSSAAAVTIIEHIVRVPYDYGEGLQDGQGTDIVRVDRATGAVTTLAAASDIVDADGKRIEVEDLELSRDETKALLIHSSVRVWRTNTRGMYHVIDFATKKLTQSPASPP